MGTVSSVFLYSFPSRKGAAVHKVRLRIFPLQQTWFIAKERAILQRERKMYSTVRVRNSALRMFVLVNSLGEVGEKVTFYLKHKQEIFSQGQVTG